MRFRISIITLFIIVVTQIPAMGVPSVSNVAGIIQDGQSVTISGGGFGTKIPAPPVLWDTIDNQASYSALTNGTTVPVGTGYPWGDNSLGFNLVKLNIGGGFSGSKSYTASGNGESTLGNLSLGGYTQNFYLSWKFKPMNSFTSGDHSTKFHRITDGSANETKVLIWDQMHHFIFWNSSYCAGDWINWSGDVGSWNNMETVISPSAYELRVNGGSLANIDIGACGTLQVNNIWKLGLEGGGNAPPSVTWYMDNIYVDRTLARVEICTNSTWAARGACEVQIPSAWSASSITATVNQGSFANGTTAYLYVVDSTGAVNTNGLAVTFGTTEADTTPPVISGGSPSGTLAAGTTQVTVSFATNEAATCRWSGVQNTPYASMTNTFPTTGGTTHSGVSAGLSDGNAYALYVKCIDVAGNVTAGDYPIAWAIASGATASGKINASGKFQFH